MYSCKHMYAHTCKFYVSHTYAQVYVLTIYMCMNIYTYVHTYMCQLICNVSVTKNGFKSK